jgi:hypothetical protein
MGWCEKYCLQSVDHKIIYILLYFKKKKKKIEKTNYKNLYS